ncbi:hypothetical protein [Citrobacter koseri]|uniref:hypothetical protein n=1 Tax=Citrobacter koseri TaxID=545 RepID=UPI0023B1661C|nr:hypothetical protein [Citrobacter koseri]
MAINYLRMQRTATRLLTENGAEYSVTRTTPPQMVNGIEIPGSKLVFAAVGVKAEYTPHEIDGTVILTGDIRLTFKAEPEIKAGDVVDIDSAKWRVIQPNPVKPATLVLCYRAQLRRVNG